MKIGSIKTFVLLSFIGLAACTNPGTSESGDAAAEQGDEIMVPELRGTVGLNMSEYGLPLSIMVPDTTVGFPDVADQSYGAMELRVGKYYQVQILEGGDLNLLKTDLAGDLLMKSTIVEEGDNYILYKSEIDGSFIDPEFHFCVVSNINGIDYEISDIKGDVTFPESAIRLMLQAALHAKGNNPS